MQITDYYKMYKKRGLKKIIKYFCEAHLYDLYNKIDTHYYGRGQTFCKNSEKIERDKKNYISYQSSWTSEIIKIFKHLNQYLEKNSLFLKDYTFLDIGSGKGKVLIEWYRLIKKLKIKQKIIGVEINTDYHQIARKNINSLFLKKKITLVNKGILKYKFTEKKYIIYLFNPFQKKILEKLIKKLKRKIIIIIYNNPKFSMFLKNNGFKIICGWKNNSKYLNLNTTFYSYNKKI